MNKHTKHRCLRVVVALSVFAFLLAAGLTPRIEAEGDDAKEETLEGTWVPSSTELGGKKLPDEFNKSIKLVIQGDNYTVTIAKEQTDVGTVKLMPSETPKAMDITGTKGPNKGKTIKAIYEHKGDTLRICYDLSGKTRPAEFKSKEGTQLFLVEYQRQKK